MEAIRGAITVDRNDKDEILRQTRTLLQAVLERNGLTAGRVRAVLFTMTRDLDAVYPAVAARQLGLTEASLMCMQEQYVVGSLPRCIRLLVLAEGERPQSALCPVYLEGAAVLRPDLAGKKPFAIAIDGPAGSGKSTVAKAVARDLGILYIDTGAMYRAVGLYCLQEGLDPQNEAQVAPVLEDVRVVLRQVDGVQHVFLNGEDVSEEIRTPEAGWAASAVGGLLPVRQRMVALQREMAQNQSVVMDGRDIGTCVLPDALLKIYLEADPAERARRRMADFSAGGEALDFETVLQKLLERDKADKTREHSPLRQAEDAVLLDTTGLSVQQVTDEILGLVRQRRG